MAFKSHTFTSWMTPTASVSVNALAASGPKRAGRRKILHRARRADNASQLVNFQLTGTANARRIMRRRKIRHD